MKFSATFAILAVLSVKTFVSALPMASMADDVDLEMRDEPLDGELYDVLARELLSYSDEFEVDAREVDVEDDFLYAREPVFGMRLDPIKMAKNTGESRLQNLVLNNLQGQWRKGPDMRVARPNPTFKAAVRTVIQQNRRPNAAEIGRQIKNDIKNTQQKIRR
ncbi:hypothetical protein EST38_g5415 [Candolleomyces aberdarensis]|uniref:Uncharacterized protein n=1 Tax=Candolleomyces aberdarensis TaxID=2316362 RepID=A0A4Q2DK44_9AGAR|nr:hypothetical protein EST38_g5415 [Candolleomyces aberdarensis]